MLHQLHVMIMIIIIPSHGNKKQKYQTNTRDFLVSLIIMIMPIITKWQITFVPG